MLLVNVVDVFFFFKSLCPIHLAAGFRGSCIWQGTRELIVVDGNVKENNVSASSHLGNGLSSCTN